MWLKFILYWPQRHLLGSLGSLTSIRSKCSLPSSFPLQWISISCLSSLVLLYTWIFGLNLGKISFPVELFKTFTVACLAYSSLIHFQRIQSNIIFTFYSISLSENCDHENINSDDYEGCLLNIAHLLGFYLLFCVCFGSVHNSHAYIMYASLGAFLSQRFWTVINRLLFWCL